MASRTLVVICLEGVGRNLRVARQPFIKRIPSSVWPDHSIPELILYLMEFFLK